MARKRFSQLTKPYQNRLLFKESGGKKAYQQLSRSDKISLRARVAREHKTANLIEARGHVPSRPSGGIANDVLDKILHPRNDGPEVDFSNIPQYFTWPRWVPHEINTEDPTSETATKFPVSPKVAASLSVVPDPSRWKHVTFTPREDEPWTMTIAFKGNAYDRDFLIPGDGGQGGEAKQVLAIVTFVQSKQQKKKSFEDIFFEVLGSDVEDAAAA